MKVLTEASGSLTSSYLIRAIQEAGLKAIASDISADIAAHELADGFVVMPKVSDPALWQLTQEIVQEHAINIVIPSLDETLLGWAQRRDAMRLENNCHVIISPPGTIEMFQDKWLTYNFFNTNSIPCPPTSLKQDFALVKPRFGRGGVGVSIPEGSVSMEGMISQELLTGTEYTVDVFCDQSGEPVYIVPRKRMNVRDGKSTNGIVDMHSGIVDLVRKICTAVQFIGPVNMQCFVSDKGDISFVEINPRIAGGMALGFAATENWIPLLVSHFIEGKAITPVPVKDGLQMMRYYAEVFVS